VRLIDVVCDRVDVQYRVEPREIKARLDSPVVMSVIAMGHPRDLICQAIETRLSTTGVFRRFFSLVSLSVYHHMHTPNGNVFRCVCLFLCQYLNFSVPC